MIQIIIAAVVFVVFCGNFLICYVKSKGQYDDYMDAVDKKEYGLKDFLPLGLWFSEQGFENRILPAAAQGAYAKYRNQVYRRILELRGAKYAGFYHMIHEGYRMAMGILVSAGASLVGLIMAVQGDSSNAMLFSAASVIAFIGLPFVTDKGLNDQIEKRRLEIRMEFPEFVNKLTLLVNAGMTISKAWEKIITDNKKDNVLYREMTMAMGEIKAGKPEAVAYEEFARRCQVKEVTKFISVILMNLRRGGAEVIPVLKQQGTECWEMRKAAAKQMGEEAGTKILLPLMIMFLGIILIVATPAVLSFSSGM